MRRLAVVLLFLASTQAFASHIVGGEIELLHVHGFQYRVNLIYYFDVANNAGRVPGGEEPHILLFIFRKSDNVKMDSINLSWVPPSQRVKYTQDACFQGELVNDKLTYTNTIVLLPEKYSDPGGYYIMWARCCRNYTISNIFSQNPDNPTSTAAGQTFYTEFPPVTIVNSSPRSFTPLKDYACVTRPYYVDFTGVDDDGDSLAYTLTDPLSTVTYQPVPPTTPRPYPAVVWIPGHDVNHIVNGSPASGAYPDMRITPEGFLTVTPKQQGLYVFAVKVEEYRNNVKIGEVRRDFQMLVVDCTPALPPVITGRAPAGATLLRDKLSVQFANTVTDADRYVQVSVSDPDANRPEDNFTEKITIKIIAENFKAKDITALLPSPSKSEIHNTGSVEFRIPIPRCPFISGVPYRIGIIAFDDACALPLADTLHVTVDVEPPGNSPAMFDAPKEITATLMEGDQQSWPFAAHDADGDSLLFYVVPKGFDADKAGMKAKVNSNLHGNLDGVFSWDAFCDTYDFTKQTSFALKLLVDDIDVCDVNGPDEIKIDLDVVLPLNAPPIIDTDLTPDPAEVSVDLGNRKIFDKINFNVMGKDLVDNSLVKLEIGGDGSDPSAYGMSFDNTGSVGTVTSPFSWDLTCDKLNLKVKNEFDIAFVAIDDNNKCRVRQTDSVVVKVKVLKPDNSPPQLSIVNLSDDIVYDNLNAAVSPGQELSLQFNVSDPDIAPKDKLSIQMIDNGGDTTPEAFSWSDVNGTSVLSQTLTWAPLCSIFNDDQFEHKFYFDFRYFDDRCLTAIGDTIRVNVVVKDKESNGFLMDPANVFTPNGDGINDYYAMEQRGASGELINILPVDNCQGIFENVRIYNRWGKQVFTSNDRNFRWYGSDAAAGVYYYHITFTNKAFKGVVSLRD